MKALTLWQPWASLVALGVKTIETRGWRTDYRGPLLIHASAAIPLPMPLTVGDYEVTKDNPRGTGPAYLLRSDRLSWPYRLPLGAVVATCTVVDVVPMVGNGSLAHNGHHRVFVAGDGEGLWRTNPQGGSAIEVTDQRPYGDYAPGRYAWLLDDVRPFPSPIPARGGQKLWNPDARLLAAVAS